MIDIHSHVLPGIDDGSKNTAESIRMLHALAWQGISYVAATPHFYPNENTPEEFLARRSDAAELLRQIWEPELPELLLGAEVYFFEGISTYQQLDKLCLSGTDLLLLEMPFVPWTERMVTELLALQQRYDITVVLAHIERYFHFAPRHIWDNLLESGVVMQCNATFFLSWKTRWKACHMLHQGKIHFLGSDCHNMSSRPPRLDEAMKAIGETGRKTLEKNIQRLLPGLEGLTI